MKKNKVYIDVNDIVGKTFGAHKVVRYVGVKRDAPTKSRVNGAVTHLYEVECVKCGEKKISKRKTVLHDYGKHTMCRVCNGRAIMGKMRERQNDKKYDGLIEAWRISDKPNRNGSTGIKRYNICHNVKTGYYVHRVQLTVDGRNYVLLQRYSRSPDLDPECVKLADEVNEEMGKGKERFYWWYENVFKK